MSWGPTGPGCMSDVVLEKWRCQALSPSLMPIVESAPILKAPSLSKWPVEGEEDGSLIETDTSRSFITTMFMMGNVGSAWSA